VRESWSGRGDPGKTSWSGGGLNRSTAGNKAVGGEGEAVPGRGVAVAKSDRQLRAAGVLQRRTGPGRERRRHYGGVLWSRGRSVSAKALGWQREDALSERSPRVVLNGNAAGSSAKKVRKKKGRLSAHELRNGENVKDQ